MLALFQNADLWKSVDGCGYLLSLENKKRVSYPLENIMVSRYTLNKRTKLLKFSDIMC